MPQQIFGADAVVASLNRAFNDQSPSNAVFLNQKAAAGTTQESFMAFAKTFGAGYAGLTADALSTKLLTNIGVTGNTGLQTALKDYITSVGVANVGIVALQLGQILSGLENATGDQAAFKAAALAWNNEVTASYNYSSNVANTGPGPVGSDDQATTGVTINLTTGAGTNFVSPNSTDGKYKTTASNDTITINGFIPTAGDQIDGGAGTDTLKITASASDLAAPTDNAIATTTIAATVTNVEKVYVTASLTSGNGAGAGNVYDGANLAVTASSFTGVQELWADGITTTLGAAPVAGEVYNSLTFNGVKLGTTIGVKGAIAADAVFNFASATGVSDAATLALAGSSYTAGAAAVVNDIETLTINSTGSTNAIAVKGSTLETVTITGDKAVSVDLSGVTATLKSVDGSAATAAQTVTTGAIASAATVKTGAAADTINLTSAAAKVTVDAGAGADTVQLTASKAHAITLGAGADTLILNATAGSLNTASAGTLGQSAVTVADFVSGTDRVKLGAGAIKTLSGTDLAQVAGATDLKAALQSAFDKAITAGGATNDAVAFQFGADSYVFFNTGGTAGAIDATDSLVKLTGVTALAAADLYV